MEILVLIGTGVILLVLLILLRKQKGSEAPAAAAAKPGYRTCPLCGESLHRGESIKSVLYPASPGAQDRMMEICGCPSCYPEGQTRRCPVCKNELKPDSVLIARCFQKPGKTHVHVLGCSQCYRGK